MKKTFSYSFSESDIDIILFTLSIFPSLNLEDTIVQANINCQCCISAGEKLISHRTDITPNELRVIAASLKAAQLIAQGVYHVDDENTKNKCNSYLFSINKLVSIFSGLFS